MRRRGVSALGLLAVLASREVSGQHGAASPSTPVMVRGCALCHGSHPGPGGSYMLTTGDLRLPLTIGVGAVSQSCLRCHLTPSTRAQQSAFEGQSPLSLGLGRYLGLDLINGHPLGRADAPGGLIARDPRRASRTLDMAGALVSGERAPLECTTCHDPHRRTSSIPTPSEERALCARCHNPASYSRAGHSTLACSNCHALHKGAGPAVSLLRDRDSRILCGSCHDPARALLNATANANAGVGMAPPAPPGHDRTANNPGGADCTSCHRPHR